jgi:hypothetical protein
MDHPDTIISKHKTMSKNYIKNLILTNPLWVKRYLTKRHPLPVDLVDRYADSIDWELLSENCSFAFSEEFCAKYEDRINWEIFLPLRSPVFKGVGRDARLISFLDRFSNKMDWYIISIWLKQPEDPAMLIKRYEDQWEWKGLSFNQDIIWTLPLLRQFRDKLKWDQISMNPDIEWRFEWLIEFEDLLDWKLFYINAYYDWGLSTLQRFSHKLSAAGVEHELVEYLNNKEGMANSIIVQNENSTIGKSQDEIKFPGYEARFEEIKKIVYRYRNKLDEINWEENIIWSEESFEYIMNYKGTDLLHLSTYSRFKEPAAILRKFGSRLIWGKQYWGTLPEDIAGGGEYLVYAGISANHFMDWTEELIDEFKDQIDWKVLSKEGYIKWTPGILEKYFDLLDKEAILRMNYIDDTNPLFVNLIVPELNEKLIEVVMGYSERMLS